MDQWQARSAQTIMLLLSCLVCWAAPAQAVSASSTSAPSVSASSASATGLATNNSPVLFIGMSGVTWRDLSPTATPALWALAERGAIASLVTKNIGLRSCRADGWLSLGAGAAAAGPRPDSGSRAATTTQAICPQLPTVTSGHLNEWSQWESAVTAQQRDAQLGTLAKALTASGRCVSAQGSGAQLAAASSNGAVPPEPQRDCPVRLVDAGAVTATNEAQNLGSLVDGQAVSTQVDPAARAAQLAGVDAAVGRALTQAAPNTRIVAASVAQDSGRPALGTLILAGEGVAPGLLASPSTRHTGLAQSVDLTATLLSLAGVDLGTLPQLIGRPLTAQADATPVAQRVQARVRTQQTLTASDAVLAPVVILLGLATLALAGALAWARSRTRKGAQRGLAAAALTLTAVPLASMLLALTPWAQWAGATAQSGAPSLRALGIAAGLLLAVAAAVALFALAVTRLVPAPKRVWLPVTVITGLTAAVIAVDVMTGTRLALTSLFGLHPLDGGRFFGIGNVPFALLGTAAILAAAGVAHLISGERPSARSGVAAAVILLAALVADAAPMWGADAGGPLALLPAGALLVLWLSGARITLARLLAMGAAACALVVGAALLDFARPASSRTHLGRFVQQVIDGSAGEVLARRLGSNWEMLNGSLAVTWLVPLGLLALGYALWRPHSRLALPLRPALEAAPWVRAALVAILVLNPIGFLSNDSGTGIPAASAMVLVPALLALIAWNAQRSISEDPDSAAASATTSPR